MTAGGGGLSKVGERLDDGLHDGPTNMARDLALLGAGRVVARVYGWDGPWVSLGASQRPERVLLHGVGVPSVRRTTGGKAVLHGHDVTIGLAAPLERLGLASAQHRSVVMVYRRIVPWLIAALRECGVDAALGEDTRFVGTDRPTADCFAHVSPNDVVDTATGIKVCGCALRLTEGAVLVQASVPAGPPLVDPAQVFASPGPNGWASVSRPQFATALARVLASVGSDMAAEDVQ